MHWLAVAMGGALGAMARYGVTVYLFPMTAGRLPLGTFVANAVGSLLIGICYILVVEKLILSDYWRHLLMVGFIGAFTTFSTFALEAVGLWQSGHTLVSVAYIGLSVVTCLVAVWLGATITLKFF